jgi:hypothetical protein
MLIVGNPVKEATMPNETDNEEGARGNVSRRNCFERKRIYRCDDETPLPW